jgi:DNA-directed RNA polymerase sigma subunit (sigma70/sigma32)
MMHRLSPRDKEILNMYYGLNWYNEHEIEEIAAHYWSRLECVRTSKEKAVRKLRNSYAADKLLRDYMW